MSKEGDAMKVEYIELTNFRNIKKQRITFADRNFVALTGNNGAGKTAILEGITKAFVPVLRTVNAGAMKECDLANSDIRNEENKTIIAILHDLNLSSAYCKEIVLMKNGKIFSKGEVESVLTKENLKAVYEMDFEIQHLTKSNQLFFVPLVSGLLNKYK